jgi:hypothetical protein
MAHFMVTFFEQTRYPYTGEDQSAELQLFYKHWLTGIIIKISILRP